jgi:hypothetical protein
MGDGVAKSLTTKELRTQRKSEQLHHEGHEDTKEKIYMDYFFPSYP